MSQTLMKTLSRDMSMDIRFRFELLVESMIRDLSYLASRQNSLVEAAAVNGWTLERIRVVIVLNAFHRILIAPLSTAFELELDCGLGSKIPIQFGESLVVDRSSGAGIRRALNAYRSIVDRAGVKEFWLSLPGTSDLVFMMGLVEDSDEEE